MILVGGDYYGARLHNADGVIALRLEHGRAQLYTSTGKPPPPHPTATAAR